jgi:hypothetical protein
MGTYESILNQFNESIIHKNTFKTVYAMVVNKKRLV